MMSHRAPPPLQQSVLPNGLTILTRELRHAPIATFWIWYRVGSRNELPGATGISHWVEHMMFKGTERHPKGSVDRLLSRRGGSFNAMTWLDFTAYYATLPVDDLELALEIEADRMSHALFDPEETEAERTVILSELHMYENYPSFRLSQEVQAAAFQLHPYHHETIGWENDLKRISRDDLVAHYRRYYTPSNAVAVAVGDFQAAEAVEQIEAHFGAIPAGPALPGVPFEEPEQRGERRVTIHGVEPTPLLSVAYKAPAATDADYWPLIIIDTILGGAKGGPMGGGGNSRTSRLYRRLVDGGLAVSAGSSLIATIDPFLFTIDVTALPQSDRGRIEAVVDEEVARLRDEPLDEAALVRARKQTRARIALGLESMSSQGRWIGYASTIAEPEWFSTYLSRIEQVDAAEVQAAARRWLQPRRRTLGWYIPEEK